jgi:hypothetical protein
MGTSGFAVFVLRMVVLFVGVSVWQLQRRVGFWPRLRHPQIQDVALVSEPQRTNQRYWLSASGAHLRCGLAADFFALP